MTSTPARAILDHLETGEPIDVAGPFIVYAAIKLIGEDTAAKLSDRALELDGAEPLAAFAQLTLAYLEGKDEATSD